MIVEVDLQDGPTLLEPDVFTAFHAASSTEDAEVVGAAMGDAGQSAGDGHVWVSISWLRAAAPEDQQDQWIEGFEAMVRFAADHGWLSDDGQHIKAHIEVPEAS